MILGVVFAAVAVAAGTGEDWRIVAADQETRSAVMFSGEPDAATNILWRWSPAEDPNVRPGDAEAFAAIDEVKPRNGGREIVVNASAGGIASVDVAKGRVRWYARVYGNCAGPHSTEVLPDGRVAVANSTGVDALQLIDVGSAPLEPARQRVVRALDVPGAHGVQYDPRRGVLYVIGYTNLYELAYSPETMSVKVLRKWDYSAAAGDEYGHDLVREPSGGYYFTNHTGVWHFDPDTGSIETVLAKANVKSYSRDRAKGTLLSVPRERWWTDRLICRGRDGTERVIGPFPGARFYKARWMHSDMR